MSHDDILWHAAETSDYLGVTSILHEGADINVVNKEGESLLYEAVMGDDFLMIKLLLEGGIDVNCVCDGHTDTPLNCAADMSSVYVAEILIEHGAKINRTDGRPSPLIHAIRSHEFWKKLDMVKLLVSRGANIFECNPRGKTLLMFAAEQYNADVLHLLIASGLDPEARDTRGNTAVYYAEKRKFDDNVDILTKEIHSRIHIRKCVEAFALGNQSRTGTDSLVEPLHPDLVDIILKMYQKSPKDMGTSQNLARNS